MPARRNRTPIAARSLAVAALGLAFGAGVRAQDVIPVTRPPGPSSSSRSRAHSSSTSGASPNMSSSAIRKWPTNVPFTFWSEEAGDSFPNPDFLEDLAPGRRAPSSSSGRAAADETRRRHG